MATTTPASLPSTFSRRSDQQLQEVSLWKVVCPSCDYFVGATASWLARGMPTCPCGAVMRRTRERVAVRPQAWKTDLDVFADDLADGVIEVRRLPDGQLFVWSPDFEWQPIAEYVAPWSRKRGNAR